MIAAPKAMSQGSNGAGGGALAFTAMSAARAEPEITASTVATKASFFMTIPIYLLEQSGFVAPRAIENRLQPNLYGPIWTELRAVKKKSEHLAAFLGV